MKRIAKDRILERLIQNSRAWLLRNVILPLGDMALGHPMMKRLRFLEEAQWWSAERLQTYRDCLLQSTIKISYKEVPFYRELMDRAGIRPDDVRYPDNLKRLPIVTKAMLRAKYPYGCTRSTGRKTHESATSGSTGTNFYVLEDNETAAWYCASFMLALEWAGWTVGERHLQTGMNLNRSLERKLKDAFLRCHYVSAFDLSDARLDQSLNLLDKRGIQHLWGYPGSLYYLACRAIKQGWNRPLRSVVTWGDNLYPHYRKTIERAFATRVFDTYGCGEGMQISAQCGYDNTYHIHALDVIVEFLDDEGAPVRDGQPGNIVVTRLHPGAMPLIRYRIGDVGMAGNGRRCRCGRGYDVMESIQGRDSDVVMTPAGNRLIVHFFTGILEHFPEIDSFQVIQETIDALVVRIVPTEQVSVESRQRIVSALQEKGATGIDIEIELVDEIPLMPGGKRRFVVNKVMNSRDQNGSLRATEAEASNAGNK